MGEKGGRIDPIPKALLGTVIERLLDNSVLTLKSLLSSHLNYVLNVFYLSLQEYVQAEKKKNSKTSSTREGKFLSSSTQIEGKSTEVFVVESLVLFSQRE